MIAMYQRSTEGSSAVFGAIIFGVLCVVILLCLAGERWQERRRQRRLVEDYWARMQRHEEL